VHVKDLFDAHKELIPAELMRLVNLETVWWDAVFVHAPDLACIELARQLGSALPDAWRTHAQEKEESVGTGDLGVGRVVFAGLFDQYMSDGIAMRQLEVSIDSQSGQLFTLADLARQVHDFIERSSHPLKEALLQDETLNAVVATFAGLLRTSTLQGT
jgi:hypothetical protein